MFPLRIILEKTNWIKFEHLENSSKTRSYLLLASAFTQGVDATPPGGGGYL